MALFSNSAWTYVTNSLCSLKQGLYPSVGPHFPTCKMRGWLHVMLSEDASTFTMPKSLREE